MTEPSSVRADIWLWCVRIFKTRNLAAQACRKGHVTIQDQPVKPSRPVRIGDDLKVRKGALTRHLRVTGLLARRVGAPLVPEFCEDRTPPEAIEAARQHHRASASSAARAPGSGRPTKKDRREIDALGDDPDRERLFEKLGEKSFPRNQSK